MHAASSRMHIAKRGRLGSGPAPGPKAARRAQLAYFTEQPYGRVDAFSTLRPAATAARASVT